MNLSQQELMKKIKDRSANIAILGLGYVGLPLATIFAEAGFKVVGVEPDQAKVDLLMNGEAMCRMSQVRSWRNW